jgi:tetraacyldisaccharide 4'-kinase
LMRAPDFWWQPRGLASTLLSPLGAIYGAVAAARLKRHGARGSLPVICVGDPTLGGAGKTPTAIAIAKLLIAAGERPCFLTRGYGGRERGPILVDPASHGADAVGDEALLLALVAPTVVAADRVAGAQFAKGANPTVIVMDDGFQNPALAKNFSLLVIDGACGVGNGRVFPAGPLRAPLAAQIEKARALVCIGKGVAGDAVTVLAARKDIPCFSARIVPDPLAAKKLVGQQVLAFAGIGRAEKFFRTLAELGAEVAERRAFPDHHPYSQGEAQELLATAKTQGLTLVTTAKDKARMTRVPELAALHAASVALPIVLEFDDAAALMRSVKDALGPSVI